MHKGHAWTDSAIVAPQVYLKKDVWLTTLFCAAHQAPAVELSLVRWRRAWLARDESLKLLEAMMSLSPILPSSIPNGELHWPAPAEINFELFGPLSINLKIAWVGGLCVGRSWVVGCGLWVVGPWLCLFEDKKKKNYIFHGNGPTRIFLFWSEAGKFNSCKQNSENINKNKNKKNTVNNIILHNETTRGN